MVKLERKIYQINQRSGFATLGNNTIKRYEAPNSEGRVVFDMATVIQEYFQNCNCGYDDSPQQRNALDVHIHNRFGDYFRNTPYKQYPQSANPFCVILFFFLTENNLVKITGYNLIFENLNRNQFGTQGDFADFVEQRLFRTRHMVFGIDVVYKSIISTTDNRLANLRNDPILRRVIVDNPPAEEITPDDALEFGQRLMIVSYENGEMIDPSRTLIGPHMDACILRFQNGFEWLTEHTQPTNYQQEVFTAPVAAEVPKKNSLWQKIKMIISAFKKLLFN